jgi:fructokinase
VIFVLSPERIVLGGGVMSQPGLLALVHREVSTLMNGYLDTAAVGEEIASYVSLPGLGPQAGVLGAIALAETASDGPWPARAL